MLLLEQFKNFFSPHKKTKASSTVNPEKVINNLSDQGDLMTFLIMTLKQHRILHRLTEQI